MAIKSSVLKENIAFLIDELRLHCELLESFYQSHTDEIYPKLISRQGYLNTLLEKSQREIAQLLHRRKPGTDFYNRLKANEQLADRLARMSQIIVRISEWGLVAKDNYPANDLSRKVVRKIRKSLDFVQIGMDVDAAKAGLKIDRRVKSILSIYADITPLIEAAKIPSHQIKATYICAYELRRLLEGLSRVGEAMVSGGMGRVVSSNNFDQINEALEYLQTGLDEVNFDRLALTRSGSAIASIKSKDTVLAVYKEGAPDKVTEEVESVNRWRKIKPGLVPKVLAHSSDRDDLASVVIEYLPGDTFEKLLLEGNKEKLDEALIRLFKTLRKLWRSTMVNDKAEARFMAQLAKRLPASQRVHANLFADKQIICGVERPSFLNLLSAVEKCEKAWSPSFSVLTHGDFNVDNIIFDSLKDKIRFIDLHRSTHQDFVQDISVLMISIYRLQEERESIRQLMMYAIRRIYAFGVKFADEQKDRFFEIRLAAGLARSFATSVRFIHDNTLATHMALRAKYLLELILSTPRKNHHKFVLPQEMLFVQ